VKYYNNLQYKKLYVYDIERLIYIYIKIVYTVKIFYNYITSFKHFYIGFTLYLITLFLTIYIGNFLVFLFLSLSLLTLFYINKVNPEFKNKYPVLYLFLTIVCTLIAFICICILTYDFITVLYRVYAKVKYTIKHKPSSSGSGDQPGPGGPTEPLHPLDIEEDRKKAKAREAAKRYYERNKEKVKENVKKYTEENKEKVKAQKEDYKEKHPDKIKAKDKKYREKNRHEILKKKRKYTQENPEKIAEKNRKYKAENPEIVKENKKRDYERKKKHL
jgi:hypothetical protein